MEKQKIVHLILQIPLYTYLLRIKVKLK